MNFLDNIKRSFQVGNVLVKLIYVNVGVFLIFGAWDVVSALFRISWVDFTRWFSAPANLEQLLLHVWTPVTYMFYHEQFWHLLFNMLVLFWFGRIFLIYYSEKQLVALYLFGGLLGAAVYIAVYNLLPYYQAAAYYSLLMGASGAIMAILTASAVRAPHMEVPLLLLGRVKLMWIAVATILISFFGLTSANAGGELAHLGGALGGYLFVAVQKRSGKDITAFITVVIDALVGIFRPRRPKMKRRTFHAQRMSPEEYNRKKAADEKEIDRILDKIKTSGYESLTPEEKRKLFEQRR